MLARSELPLRLRLQLLLCLPQLQLDVRYLLAARPAAAAAAAATRSPLEQVVYQHAAVGVAQNLLDKGCSRRHASVPAARRFEAPRKPGSTAVLAIKACWLGLA